MTFDELLTLHQQMYAQAEFASLTAFLTFSVVLIIVIVGAMYVSDIHVPDSHLKRKFFVMGGGFLTAVFLSLVSAGAVNHIFYPDKQITLEHSCERLSEQIVSKSLGSHQIQKTIEMCGTERVLSHALAQNNEQIVARIKHLK